MKRGLNDGIVKSTLDGLGAPFEQFYLDSWIVFPFFRWKIIGGNEPQVVDYIKRTVVKKVITNLVLDEVNEKMISKYKIEIDESGIKEFYDYLDVTNIGNPLNLKPTTADEYDDAHLETARSLPKCIIITGDNGLIRKDPSIVWFYGKVRQVQSVT